MARIFIRHAIALNCVFVAPDKNHHILLMSNLIHRTYNAQRLYDYSISRQIQYHVGFIYTIATCHYLLLLSFGLLIHSTKDLCLFHSFTRTKHDIRFRCLLLLWFLLPKALNTRHYILWYRFWLSFFLYNALFFLVVIKRCKENIVYVSKQSTHHSIRSKKTKKLSFGSVFEAIEGKQEQKKSNTAKSSLTNKFFNIHQRCVPHTIHSLTFVYSFHHPEMIHTHFSESQEKLEPLLIEIFLLKNPKCTIPKNTCGNQKFGKQKNTNKMR